MQKRLNKVPSSSKLLLWPSSFKFFVRNFATVRLDCWDGKSWISSSRETHHLSFFTFMKDNCPEAKAWIKKLKPTRVQIFFLLFHQKSAKKNFWTPVVGFFARLKKFSILIFAEILGWAKSRKHLSFRKYDWTKRLEWRKNVFEK